MYSDNDLNKKIIMYQTNQNCDPINDYINPDNIICDPDNNTYTEQNKNVLIYSTNEQSKTLLPCTTNKIYLEKMYQIPMYSPNELSYVNSELHVYVTNKNNTKLKENCTTKTVCKIMNKITTCHTIVYSPNELQCNNNIVQTYNPDELT